MLFSIPKDRSLNKIQTNSKIYCLKINNLPKKIGQISVLKESFMTAVLINSNIVPQIISDLKKVSLTLIHNKDQRIHYRPEN